MRKTIAIGNVTVSNEGGKCVKRKHYIVKKQVFSQYPVYDQ